jgi:hypothetical protein
VELEPVTVVKVDKLAAVVVRTAPVVELRMLVQEYQVVVVAHLVFVPTSYYS